MDYNYMNMFRCKGKKKNDFSSPKNGFSFVLCRNVVFSVDVICFVF